MNPTTRTYRTTVDLDVAVRGEMIGVLNQQLADSLDLYSQTKQAHWNVKGMDFIALHKLFDDVAAAVEETVDTVAERVTALGADARGTVRMSAANSTLPEFPENLEGGEEFVHAMVERVGAYANSSRQAANKALEAGDEITADVFVGITREMDKLLYFLEAHIQ
ncbi:MAG: DNA starvation/stationary phase protection protein Dps [Chloroflexota bacterium]